jgi:hypothetical protein
MKTALSVALLILLNLKIYAVRDSTIRFSAGAGIHMHHLVYKESLACSSTGAYSTYNGSKEYKPNPGFSPFLSFGLQKNFIPLLGASLDLSYYYSYEKHTREGPTEICDPNLTGLSPTMIVDTYRPHSFLASMGPIINFRGFYLSPKLYASYQCSFFRNTVYRVDGSTLETRSLSTDLIAGISVKAGYNFRKIPLYIELYGDKPLMEPFDPSREVYHSALVAGVRF